MIYRVNAYDSRPTYFDEATNPNAKAEADAYLIQKQSEALVSQAFRFSICATFVDGNDTVWRSILETDPEETVCQVFDHTTGTYTECNSKTEAFALNEQKKQEFLASIGIDKVYELDAIPEEVKPYAPATYGENVGDIPVEVM